MLPEPFVQHIPARMGPRTLEILDIPAQVLPEVLPSCGLFGVTHGLRCLPDGIPIYGVAGDQQAALFDSAASSRAWLRILTAQAALYS